MQLTHKMAQKLGYELLDEARRLEELGTSLLEASQTGEDHIVYSDEGCTEYHKISASTHFEYNPNYDYLITDKSDLEEFEQAPPDPLKWAA